MKTVVIGSGSWGTALAQVLADNKEEVILYGIEKSEIDDINLNHENSKYFEGVELNPNLKATDDITVVKDADIVLLAVPTFAIEGICLQIDPYLKNNIIVVNVSKGFHPETSERMSEVIRRCISKEHLSSVVSLIGPSHAEEVVIRLLTTIDAVSLKEEDAQVIQRTFSNNYLRIYTGDDEIGSELGVAIKNVMAIASGILSGLGYQDNTRAALITRGLQEMIRYGVFFGGKQQTFMGLTGIGDLIVTCTSMHSRNRRAGILLGQGKSLKETLESVHMVVEGVNTATAAYEMAHKYNVEMPIVEEAYNILYNGRNAREAVLLLMTREKREEK